MPTRLRRYEDFESSLASVDGTRNIFELRSTILPENPAKNNQAQTTEEDEDGDSETIQNITYGIDFSANDTAKAKRPHIFSQVRVSRGWEDGSEQNSLSQRRQSTQTNNLVHK